MAPILRYFIEFMYGRGKKKVHVRYLIYTDEFLVFQGMQ